MDIIAVTREMEQHRLHVMRVRNMQPTLDTSTPKSLGLKHLASRPKKQQLIDDRQQSIAKENKKLMERMTKIMMASKEQPKHVTPKSLNFNRLEVDRLNFENKLLLERLKTVPPVLDRNKMERDFARHCKIGAHLRRRQIKPLNLSPKGNENVSQEKSLALGGSFDAASYISQQASSIVFNGGDSSILSTGLMGAEESPIKSMTEFRKHVLSSKKHNFIPTIKTNPSSGGENRHEYSHNPTSN